MSDMKIQDLFNFLSHFRGDSAKEKLENLEETCGDGDGKLVRNEFRNAVRQNEDMIKAYGWNGERSNMDDLADIWFAKLDTIKSSSKVEGTYYNNDGTLTEGEEAGANSLEQNLINSGWVSEYKEELRNADFSMISKYKGALENSKLLVKQNQDLFNKSTDEKVKAALGYIEKESTDIEKNGIREYTQEDIKTLQSHCAVLQAVVELEDKKSDCIHDVVAFQSKYPDDAEEVNAIINKHFTDDYVNYINSQTDIKVLEQKLSAFTKDVAAFEAAKNPTVNGGENVPPNGGSGDGTITFGISSTTNYNASTKTFSLKKDDVAEFSITGITNFDDYEFTGTPIAIEKTGSGKFKFTAGDLTSGPVTVTVTAKDKDGNVVGTTTFKVKLSTEDVNYNGCTDNITPVQYIDTTTDWKTGQNDVKKYMKEELKKNLNTLATTLITQGYSEDIINAAMTETLNLYNGIIDSWPSAEWKTGKYVTYSYTNSKTGETREYKAYTQYYRYSKDCANWCEKDENTLGITFSKFKPDSDIEYKGLINFNKVKKVFETFCQELNDYQGSKFQFGITSDSSAYYDESTNTFTMSQGATTEFDITGINKDDIANYSFESDSSYVEYLGNGKFELTAPASSSNALTVTITAKDSDGNTCGKLTFNIKSSNVDFKDDATLVEINGENYKLSSLLKDDTLISIKSGNFRGRKDNAQADALSKIKSNLSEVVKVLKENNYNETALNKAYDRTIDYYSQLLFAASFHKTKTILLVDYGQTGTDTCTFTFEGEQHSVTTAYIQDQDPRESYTTGFGDNCGIIMITDLTASDEYLVVFNFAKIVQKFYEFLTGAL